MERSKMVVGFIQMAFIFKATLKTTNHLAREPGTSQMAIILKVFTLRSPRKVARMRRSPQKMKKVPLQRRSSI
jgi:hypothetical protein